MFFKSCNDLKITSNVVDATLAAEISRVMLCNRISRPNTFVYSLLQGREGEDGVIQGVLDFLHVRGNVGPIGPSLLSADKFTFLLLSKAYAPELGIAKSSLLPTDVEKDDIRKFLEEANVDRVIVRPNWQGASVYTDVFSVDDLDRIYALCVDISVSGDQALIQEFISGTEINCGCLHKNGKWTATQCYTV